MTTFQRANRSHGLSAGLVSFARASHLVARLGAELSRGLAGLANERARTSMQNATRETCDLRYASELFSQAIQEDSNLETDWLWYAGRLERDDERCYCLQRAVQINPRSQPARRELARLG